MVRDQHEHPWTDRLVDPTGRVGNDQRPHPEPSEDANAEDGAIGTHAIVEMGAPPHDRYRDAVDLPEDEHARVTDRRGDRPAGNLLVRDLHTVLERVRE